MKERAALEIAEDIREVCMLESQNEFNEPEQEG